MDTYILVKDDKVLNVLLANKLSVDVLASVKTEKNVDEVLLIAAPEIEEPTDTPDTGEVPQSPFTSWTWNSSTKSWVYPTSVPSSDPAEGKAYTWNEENKVWDTVTLPIA